MLVHGQGQSPACKLLLSLEIKASRWKGVGPLCPVLRGAGQFVPSGLNYLRTPTQGGDGYLLFSQARSELVRFVAGHRAELGQDFARHF